jgi:subtilase family serine protease
MDPFHIKFGLEGNGALEPWKFHGIEFQTSNIEPDCIRTEYNVNGYTPIASSGSRIGYGSFLNQSSGFSDLALFEQHFNIPSQNFSVILINNGTDLPQPPPLADDGEANLDVQKYCEHRAPFADNRIHYCWKPAILSGPC